MRSPGLEFQSAAPILIALLVLVNARISDASLNVTQWQLTTGVADSSDISTVQDFDTLTTISNPFQTTSDTAVGPNTATTIYDFSWSGDSGSFDITTTQRVETFRVFTDFTGFIFIAPTADLRMTIDASLDYASTPGDLADVLFSMLVLDENNVNNPVFFESLQGGNLTLEPAVGTLAISGDIILPAGTTYLMRFTARNDNGSDNNPTGPITSSGFFHFAFQPIPEPATAYLIALGAIALRRPKRR